MQDEQDVQQGCLTLVMGLNCLACRAAQRGLIIDTYWVQMVTQMVGKFGNGYCVKYCETLLHISGIVRSFS